MLVNMKARNDNNQNEKKNVRNLFITVFNRAAVLFAFDFPPKQKKKKCVAYPLVNFLGTFLIQYNIRG
jgi:hypothetical protein